MIVLTHVTLAVEQGRDGKFNFEVPSSAGSSRPEVDPMDVSLADVALVYTDRQNGNEWRAESCDMQSGRLQISAAKTADLINSLAITGAASCKQIQTRKLALSDVTFKLDAKQGLFEFKDITMRAYDGRGSGDVHANFTGHVPSYRVHYVLASFRIEAFWKNFSQKKIGAGLMNFSTDLTLSGYTVRELTASSVGEASLRGSHLTLATGDLDGELSRYESTQEFSLIDVGAFLVAGPLGVAVTKGYDFARVLGGTGGSSEIPSLTSEWHIEHGVALAKDVAMTTTKNRIALKGALDFVNDHFQDVTVALVDKQGCVRVSRLHAARSANRTWRSPTFWCRRPALCVRYSNRRNICWAGTARCFTQARCRRLSERSQCGLFQDPLHVFLDVAELRLHLAEVLLHVAFCLQHLVAHKSAAGFLDAPFRLCDAPLNLIFVDAHDVLLSGLGRPGTSESKSGCLVGLYGVVRIGDRMRKNMRAIAKYAHHPA